MLNGRKRAVSRIINNLLSNASKFTPVDGEIVITARVDKMGALLINIADNGIGISKNDIIRMLEPFEQANRYHPHKHEGTGLGLHLCQNLMKLHGGSLEIDSKLGEGTTVILTFPPGRTTIEE